VTHQQHCGARARALGEQQVEEGPLAVLVQGRGRLVGDHQLRAADDRTRGCDALPLTDRQLGGRARQQLRREIETRGEPARLPARRAPRALDGLPPPAGEPAGQRHPADQRKQAALAAAARPVQDHALACGQAEVGDLEAWREMTAPAKHDVLEPDEGSACVVAHATQPRSRDARSTGRARTWRRRLHHRAPASAWHGRAPPRRSRSRRRTRRRSASCVASAC